MDTAGRSGRIWLDVPFQEKDAAKAAGAHWDQRARRWYAPRRDVAGLERWLPQPGLPTVLPGEDRQFGLGPGGVPLFVDLVPSSCWFTNVRSCVGPRDWDRVRRMVYGRAGRRCEACGRPADPSRRIWLEAHERWEYDTEPTEPMWARLGLPVQRLKRLVCLCTLCHEATHFGLASLRGRDDAAMRHLMEVNGWTRAQANEHISAAFDLFEERSRTEWLLDLRILLHAGVEPLPPHI